MEAQLATTLITTFNFLGDQQRGEVAQEETARCMEAFYDGLKQSKSIRDLKLFLLTGAPIFDLEYFALNNKSFESLGLSTPRNMQPTESESIARMMGICTLDSLSLSSYVDDDGSLERIIPMCLMIKTLCVNCKTDAEYDALALLLRDQTALLQEIKIFGGSQRSDILGVSQVIDGLSGNKKVKVMDFYIRGESGGTNEFYGEVSNQMRHLVCNTSSIEGIINSNHTLGRSQGNLCPIASLMGCPVAIKSTLAKCLELNQHEDKQFVIRQKITKYYFKEEFNVAPFEKMNISLIPEVMCIIGEDDKDQWSAIYRLLKTIPNLCNPSRRNDEEEIVQDDLTMSSNTKRQKI